MRFVSEVVAMRGIEVVRRAVEADVAVFGLEEGSFPGEASHVVAARPDAKILAVDEWGCVALVLESMGSHREQDIAATILHLATGAGAHDR